MKENLKVGAAALLGISSSASSAFFGVAEPILRLLLLVGQVGVATVTIVYIWGKIKNLRKK